jgi:hypothetical protein
MNPNHDDRGRFSAASGHAAREAKIKAAVGNGHHRPMSLSNMNRPGPDKPALGMNHPSNAAAAAKFNAVLSRLKGGK